MDGSVVAGGAISAQLQSIAEPDELQEQLRQLAKEIASGLSGLKAAQSNELLGAFVSELFLSASEQKRREECRQKQEMGIAAAKARGVRFGRRSNPLPDGFDEVHQAWRGGKLTLRQAADACGMPQSSFYDMAVRRERAAD